MIHLHDKTFVPFISSEEIDFAIANMAKKMADDFFDENPTPDEREHNYEEEGDTDSIQIANKANTGGQQDKQVFETDVQHNTPMSQ